MSSVVKANCPKCKTQISVEEDQADVPVNCSSCQSTFVPAAVIAESNRRFEMGMYAVMLLVGVGLIVFLAMTGQLKPKADAAKVPPAAEAPAGNK